MITLKKYIYKELLRVGIIQTTVDCNFAWKDLQKNEDSLKMNELAEQYVTDELRKGFREFDDLTEKPHIILIPEYSIPHGTKKTIEQFACELNAVVFGGLDLCKIDNTTVANRGIIIIPNNWPNNKYTTRSHTKYFGKTFLSEEEIRWFEKNNVNHMPETCMYIVNAGQYGIIGIAICSDFYDLERLVLYKGKIHHLFIISYNRDCKSFDALAEAISRLLFCNVIICNTGHYGNSLAYSPYKEDYKRIIYKTIGSNIFSTQVINLPVKVLDEEQKMAHKQFQTNFPLKNKDNIFKWPPGYFKSFFDTDNSK